MKKIIITTCLIVCFGFIFIPKSFAQTADSQSNTNDSVYTELKSYDPNVCLEKKAEYTDGIDQLQNLVANNLHFTVTDGKTATKEKTFVRVVAEKTKAKKAKTKKSHINSTNIKDIKELYIETTNSDYVTRGEIYSKSIGINSGRYPAVIVGSDEIEGSTLVGFIIEKDGMVSNVKIVETKCDKANDSDNSKLIRTLETEIIRIIYLSAGNWTPAEMNCENVRIYVTLPINWKYTSRSVIC